MKFKLEVSATLLKLSKLLPNPLYIVGGYVRDNLLGFNSYDIDICGKDTPDIVFDCLKGTGFKVKTTSEKLMTLKIIGNGEEYEYTTFRKESYQKGHSPQKVEPTDSIIEDAKRRDFKVNAIYYDIASDKLCDPLDGLRDLEKKVLSTACDPQKVFGEDGLRLMRLARFSGELGFTAEAETLNAAKEYASLIKDIAPERIRDELDKILVADTCHNVEFGHIKAINLLDEIDVLDIILPEITLGKGMMQRADFHKYDVFGHIIETVRFASPNIRLAALLHDVAKPYCFIKSGKYRGHDIEGERIARDILTRLHYSNKIIAQVCRLVRLHMYDLKNEAKPNTLRLFIQENVDILDYLIALKEADFKGSGMNTDKAPSASRLKEVYNVMCKENVPFAIKDLQVRGEDLEGIPREKRSMLLKTILRESALLGSELISREQQLAYIQKRIREE
ncbi:MAG TPA: CCA tRNA nucleotidyltransferase [Clostridia bacterium]|nr:CCA tRNA nucleotidyltransferase [Clostridia bacterium]